MMSRLIDRRIFASQASLADLMALRHPARYLSLARLRDSKALLTGAQQSKIQGRGLDFDEVRRYQAGDDLRYIDWRVTARTGKPHTKLFREQRQSPVYIIVDLSASMFFGTKVTFKSVIAQQASALIAWAAGLNQESVGGAIVGVQGKRLCRLLQKTAGSMTLIKMMHRYGQSKPEHTTEHQSFHQLLRQVSPKIPVGAQIFIFSDFMHFNEPTKRYLYRIAYYNDLNLGLIYDPLEANLPYKGHYPITDGSKIVEFDAANSALRHEFQQGFNDRWQTVQGFCRRHRFGFLSLRTDEDVAAYLRQLCKRN